MEWWKEFYDEDMEKIMFSQEMWEIAEKDCEYIPKMLDISPSEKIFDLACGIGRYSIPLAKKGFKITGLDYSENFIEKAKEKAKSLKLNIDFLQGDMREIPFENQFSVVICMFTSFGHFLDEKDHLKTPRIAGVIFKNELYFGIVRHDLIFAKKLDLEKGKAFLLSTYGFKEKIEKNIVDFDVSDIKKEIERLELEEVISCLVFSGEQIEILSCY